MTDHNNNYQGNRPTYGAVRKNLTHARPRPADSIDICPARTEQEGSPTGHWWIIEGQQGDVSIGKCKCCSVRKTFINSSYRNDVDGDGLRRRVKGKRKSMVGDKVESKERVEGLG